MAKRSHGEGSLYRLANGNWRALLTVSGGKRLSYTSKSKSQAAEWLKKTIWQNEHGYLEKFVKDAFRPPKVENSDRKRRPKANFVYLLREEHGLVKIGKTICFDTRFAQINLGIPYSLVFQVVIETQFSDQIEAHLLDAFQDKRVKGEWFDLTDDDIQVIVKYLFLVAGPEHAQRSKESPMAAVEKALAATSERSNGKKSAR